MKIAAAVLVGAMQFGFMPARLQALDSTRQISQYAHTAWRLQEGILNGVPTCITQTSDGYLWVGTQGTLFRFDGVRFVPWTPPNSQKLPSDDINYLAPAKDGGLWIGTSMGLARWTGRELLNFSPAGRISDMLVDQDGNAWVTRSRVQDKLGSLCEAVGSRLECHGEADGLDPVLLERLAKDAAGNFWLGAPNSLVRWRKGSSTTYSIKALQRAEGLSGIEGLAVAKENSLWVGIDQSGPGLGLQHFLNGQWKPLVVPGFDSSTLEVVALFSDRAGDLWAGTINKGIYRIHGNQIDHFDSSGGLSADLINGFFEDREGSLWVATTSGIDNFRDLPVATFSKRQGLSSDSVDSVVAAQDGSIWVGTLGALDSIHDGHVSSIRSHDGLPGKQVTAMLEDHRGQLWVGVDNGLYMYHNARFTPMLDGEGKPTGSVVSLAESSDQTVWANTSLSGRHRVICFHDGKAQQELSSPQVPLLNEVDAAAGPGVWMSALAGGMTPYYDGKFNADLLKQSAKLGQFQGLAVEPDGSVWGATRVGLAAWKEGALRVLSQENGLPCDSIYALLRDAHQALWLYSHCGLIRIDKAELDRWWAHPSISIQTLTFGAFSGAQPGHATFRPAATRSLDGRLWFGNDSTVQMIDPDHLDLNPLPPPIQIEQVVAQDAAYPARNQLRLPPHTRDIQIDYTALSFVSPQRVFFRVMLEGHDPEWKDAGTRRSAFYTNLGPGRYRFLVKACNNDGVWNEQGSEFAFLIAPAWYQAIWFRVLFLLLAIFLGYLFYLSRLRQYASTVRMRFNERLEERTRIARDLHDTLLQTIQGSKLVADEVQDYLDDPPRAKHALDRLSLWLSQAVDEGRAALESLRISAQSEQLSEALRCAAENNAPASMLVSLTLLGKPVVIHPVVRDEVYRVALEAIRNACMHSRASLLTIELNFGRDLTIRVNDNGRGFDSNLVHTGKPGHFGISGMKERAAKIGARVSFATASGNGTEFSLVVPGRVIFGERDWRRVVSKQD
jgi:signal transduction histidine kinase/ligand-binding sensor domain-containing protein